MRKCGFGLCFCLRGEPATLPSRQRFQRTSSKFGLSVLRSYARWAVKFGVCERLMPNMKSRSRCRGGHRGDNNRIPRAACAISA